VCAVLKPGSRATRSVRLSWNVCVLPPAMMWEAAENLRVEWSRRVPGLRLRSFSSGQPLVTQVGADRSDELICAPDGLVSVVWGYYDHLLVITLLTKFECPVQ